MDAHGINLPHEFFNRCKWVVFEIPEESIDDAVNALTSLLAIKRIAKVGV
jgi:hypothetical protein